MCDPLAATSGSGNAYDRENSDIGLVMPSFIHSPVPNFARIEVKPSAAVSGVQLFLDNPPIAAISPLKPTISPETVIITPHAPGAGLLSNLGDSNPAAVAITHADKLGTWVFPQYPTNGPINVAYWILADTATLGVSISELGSIISNVNLIWQPQANISLRQFGEIGSITPTVSVEPLFISENSALATSILVVPYLNVYFVPRIEDDVTPSDEATLGFTVSAVLGKQCNGQPLTSSLEQMFIATQGLSAQQITLTIAHEIGHALGLSPGLEYSGSNLRIDSKAQDDSYILMAHGDGVTITPRQRDCLSSVMFDF